MSAQAVARGQMVAQGGATPPGRPVGPGVSMPSYQVVPSASWDGAARGVPNAPNPTTVTKHIGFPSNAPIHSSHVVKPWSGGEHNLLREGQIIFSARSVGKGTGRQASNDFNNVATQASLQHLNRICALGYAKARQDLVAGRLPGGISITVQQFDDISESDLEDYFGSPERENLIPKEDILLQMAVNLLHIDHFKYLRPMSVRMHWNLFGGINNTSAANSPEAKADRSNGATVVVNSVVAKRVYLSNIWGGSAKLIEGSKLGLILRRAGGNSAMLVGAPEFTPWSDRDAETPSMAERGYFDERNRFQHGHYIPIGVCQEVTGQDTAERKRKDAIGTGDRNPLAVHDALGTLPKILVGFGHY